MRLWYLIMETKDSSLISYMELIMKTWKKRKLSLLIGMALFSGNGFADEDHLHKSEAELINPKQSIELSETIDVQILATETGVDEKAIRQSLAYQDQFAEMVMDIHQKYPNKIARVWLESAPSQEGFIQFVGDIPELKSAVNATLMGGATYSLQEQEARAAQLTELMKANDYSNFVTYFDNVSGLIKLEMKVADSTKSMRHDQLSQVLATALKQGEDEASQDYLKLSVDDIDYEVVYGEGEIYELDTARGGEWLTDDGVRECTSGWAVSGPNGNGIVTAAHCVGLNGLDHHFTTSDPTMTWRSQERGNGDVEYHTTSHTETAEYWATSNGLRDVTAIRATFLMLPGISVCEYGRSSNTRTCNHTVISNNVTTTFTDGVTVSNLVRVTGDNSIGGDSGGPWSWGTVAWGVHSGSNGSTSVFTPVQRAQSELNITILTQ